MKTAITTLILSLSLFIAAVGCKTQSLESGGVYAPTNSLGQVVYSDTGLAFADASYKFAYESVQSVFKFERDNRGQVWAISPSIKQGLDKARPVAVDIDQRWAKARAAYRINPTPNNLTTLQGILTEIQKLLPVVQSQIEPAMTAITKN